MIEELTPNDLGTLEEKGSISIKEENFSPEDIVVFREAKEGTQTLSNRFISIDLDCKLDFDLIEEGLAREVVNRIQKSRKDLNFNVADRINVTYSGAKELEQGILKHKDYIQSSTLALTLEKGDPKGEGILTFDIEEYQISFKIIKA